MEVTKVLYNVPYGGFRLPGEICKQFQKKYGERIYEYMSYSDKLRADPRLVELYEKSKYFEDGEIAIAEVPAGCVWTIHEYDGKEYVTWTLPEATIIEDLRKLLIGETVDDIHPITKHFLESGISFKEFESYFRKKFTHPDHA